MWQLVSFTLISLFVILVLAWLAGVIYLNDFAITPAELARYRQVLVIFPHPDDETNVAGLLWRLRQRNIPTTLAVLTAGERGTPDAHLDESLKTIRCTEMRQVCKLFHTAIIQDSLGDGQLAKRRQTVQKRIAEIVKEVNPDLVITYDLAGMYGHEDHITCAELVTTLVREEYPTTHLWYVSFAERLMSVSKLPTSMAKDPGFAARRSTANLRVFAGAGIAAKVRSVYLHRSQRQAFRKSSPAHLPLWFVYSLGLNEYFQQIQ